MTFIDLKDRVSIITGGSRGIGAAAARELAAAGSHVAIFDLDVAQGSAYAADIARDHGVRAKGYAVDVRDVSAIEQACADVAATFGGIDHLINNAGIQFVAPLADYPIEKWKAVTAINLDGVFYCLRGVWKYMVQRGRGRIVNIASVHGIVASEFKPAYVAAKHGVVGLTRSAALEGGPLGITTNAVAPGAVMTDLIRDQAADLVNVFGGNMTEEEALAKAFLTEMPSGRFIEPEEVGKLCAYLCSDAARSINGAVVSIDGGWAAH